MKTTLNAIRAHSPCAEGWKKLLQHLGKTEADDAPLSIATVLDSNGLDDAIWCLRAITGYDRELRLFAVWCARRVQHLNTDPRVEAALVAAEGFANGTVCSQQLDKAWCAAKEAARVAASSAACAAARTAAWAAVSVETIEVAIDASVLAVWTAIWTVGSAQERTAQATELRRVCAEIDAGGAK